jgi:hypothetical protein
MSFVAHGKETSSSYSLLYGLSFLGATNDFSCYNIPRYQDIPRYKETYLRVADEEPV